MNLKEGPELDANPAGRKNRYRTCTFGPNQAQDLGQVTHRDSKVTQLTQVQLEGSQQGSETQFPEDKRWKTQTLEELEEHAET